MDRNETRKALLAVPGAIGGAAAVASVWQTPRDWIGDQFAALGSAMTHPWVTVLVTLSLVAYAAAIIWTYLSPSAAEMPEVEADRERRSRRRKMLNEAREMVAKYELQTRWDWPQTMRYSAAFTAIRPHLSAGYMKAVANNSRIVIPGQLHEFLVVYFIKELDRLEREWKLS